MRPFKMFFGLAIGVILFLFLARIVFIAFIVAAVMSILYAIFRRVREFINYDSNREYYRPAYNFQYPGRERLKRNIYDDAEPLFEEDYSMRHKSANNIQFVDII